MKLRSPLFLVLFCATYPMFSAYAATGNQYYSAFFITKTLEAPGFELTQKDQGTSFNALTGYANSIQQTPILDILYASAGHDEFEAVGIDFGVSTNTPYNATLFALDPAGDLATINTALQTIEKVKSIYTSNQDPLTILSPDILAVNALQVPRSIRDLHLVATRWGKWNSTEPYGTLALQNYWQENALCHSFFVPRAILQPVSDAFAQQCYQNITQTIQNAFSKSSGGLYVPRLNPNLLVMASVTNGIDQTLPDAGTVKLGHQPTGTQTFTAAQYLARPGTLAALQKSCEQNAFELVSTAPAHNKAPIATMGSVPITPIPSLQSNNATVGIVYRDANGIHYRRFEGWQNIALPMITSETLTSRALDGATCSGGYFYAHQLEEIGRGLITATVAASNVFNLLVTDRFGWGSTFSSGTTLNPGVMMPLSFVGPDMFLTNGNMCARQSMDFFHLRWANTGATIFLKPGGFGICPETTLARNAESGADISFNPYLYYDENSQLQKITLSSAARTLPPITSATWTGTPSTQIPVWFAFDSDDTGTIFSFGTGTPTSQHDINSSASVVKLFQTTLPTGWCRYARSFGFFTEGSNTATITNIKSRFLNPIERFRTPPCLKGNFLFWRPEWSLGKGSSNFVITFRAAGPSIQLAIGTKDYHERCIAPPAAAAPKPKKSALDAWHMVDTRAIELANTCSFDTSYVYALNASATTTSKAGVTITKQGATPQLITQPGPTALPLTGSNNDQYLPYWFAYDNGTISFGSGTTVGQNTIASAVDPSPVTNCKSFCFSGDVRTTDYIDIAANTAAKLTSSTTENAGTFNQWSPLQQTDNAIIIVDYVLASGDPTTASFSVGLTNNTTAGTNTPLIPNYTVTFGAGNNTTLQINKQTTVVAQFPAAGGQTLLPVSSTPASTSGAPSTSAQTAPTVAQAWIAYQKGKIICGLGSTPGQNILGTFIDPAPFKNISKVAITSTTPTMQYAFDSISTSHTASSYAAAAGQPPHTDPWWLLATPNAGTITFRATSNNSIATIALTSADGSSSYTIVFNDDGAAYLLKNGIKIASTVVTLTSTQFMQVSAQNGPSSYWLSFTTDTNTANSQGYALITFGQGTTPGATASTILSYKDEPFDATKVSITNLSLGALSQNTDTTGSGKVFFSGLTFLPATKNA